MSNICLTVAIEKNWRSQNFSKIFKVQKICHQVIFGETSTYGDLIEF